MLADALRAVARGLLCPAAMSLRQLTFSLFCWAFLSRAALAQAPEQPAPEAAALEVPAPPDVAAVPEAVDPPSPEAAPEAAEEEADDEEPGLRVSAEPGRGFTIAYGDAFSAQLRIRAQIRATVRAAAGNDAETAFELRTARIWWTGHVIDPNLRYGMQLALGANDFEAGNASPIFDLFAESTHLRELNIRVGQFFVPFDRARTVRESALMTVDRTDVVRELTLDRDIGIVVSSTDLFGLGGVLSYYLGFWGGDGRNRLGFNDAGFLYTARVSVRPMGGFDDDQESDLTRGENPRLAIGVGAAYNQATDRPRSTTGTRYVSARPDYYHFAADLVFKWAGFSFLGEFVWREADQNAFDYVDDDGNMQTEWSRSGYGYLLQAGVLVYEGLEFWARWEQLFAGEGTDPALITQATTLGNGLSAGANYYINGHSLKVQADWSHSFGDQFDLGTHVVRLQLDASF
jgi:hypothetical protein